MINTNVRQYGLLLLIIVFLTAGYWLWQVWPTLMIASMHWQKEINGQLSELLYDAQSHILSAGLSLAGLSFIYGILHSLGPGHGKLIVSTYLATHPTKVKISLILTILSALLQAVVAVALVSALLALFNSSMQQVNSEANRLITLSFYTVVVLGLVIVWRSLSALYKVFSWQSPQAIKIEAIKPIPLLTAEHSHSDSCGCGHQHIAGAQAINSASSFKEYAVIIASIGMRPCTGAIMVLLFANMVDIYWLGVISAFLMAVGTALSTSVIALMTIAGRQLARRYINNKAAQLNGSANNRSPRHFSGPLIRLTGGLALIVLGALLLSTNPVGMAPFF